MRLRCLFLATALLATFLVQAQLVQAQSGDGTASESLGRIMEHLRQDPGNGALLDRVIRIIERHESVADVAERLQTAAASATDQYLVARLWQAAGRPAKALTRYEAAIAADPQSSLAYLPLCDLYLRGRWHERALELWKRCPKDQLEKSSLAEMEYRLAYGSGKKEAARVLIQAATDVSVEERVRWAQAAGAHQHVALLQDSREHWPEAIAAYLRAGLWQRALEIHEQSGVKLDDESAYRLARASGRVSILETHLGDREDAAASNYREKLSLSVGATHDDTVVTRSDETATVNRTPRQKAAMRVLEGGSADEQDPVEQLVSTDGPPSLLAVTALLESGRDADARHELTRWILEPDPTEERSWLPRLERGRPEWFGGRPLISRLSLTSQPAPVLLAEIDRVLAATEPGSESEARLLFHRGRLSGNRAQLERSARVSPSTLVKHRRADSVVVQPIARAVALLLDDPWPGTIPELTDTALGSWNGRVVRRRRGPLPQQRVWSIEHWTMDTSSASDNHEQLDWDANGVRFSNGESWRAGSLAPLVAAIRLPATGWLVVGRGAALFDREALRSGSNGLVWQVDMTDTPTVTNLAARLDGLASPGLMEFLDGLRPPRLPNWTIINEFLTGVRRRHRDPNLRVESLLASGDRVILRAESGERAVLVAGIVQQPSNDMKLEQSFTRTEWGWIRKERRTALPMIREEPMPLELERAWQRQVGLPTREFPIIEPIGPDEPIVHLHRDPVVAAAGQLPRVLVAGDGSVYYHDRSEPPVPRWIGHITPPLPGPLGFPEHPDPLPGHATRDRGPHRAGPVADSRTPRVFMVGHEAYVCTDRVVRFGPDGNPSQLRLAHDVEEIRDLAVDPGGQVWILSGTTSEVLSSTRSVRFPETGAFDLESVDGSLFVLGYEKTAFWLRELDLETAHSTRHSLPDLAMDRDREGLRITSLGRWGTTLLLLHDRLYSTTVSGEQLRWRIRLEWPGHDPHRLPFYQQTRPRVVGDTLILARPWGVIEGWRGKEKP